MKKIGRSELLGENKHLYQALCSERRKNVELQEANANLQVERDAADALLGAAMDEVLGRRRA